MSSLVKYSVLRPFMIGLLCLFDIVSELFINFEINPLLVLFTAYFLLFCVLSFCLVYGFLELQSFLVISCSHLLIFVFVPIYCRRCTEKDIAIIMSESVHSIFTLRVYMTILCLDL